MLYQTTIPAGGTEEKEIRSLVDQLSRVSGQPIVMELQLCISTESIEMSSILDSLADAIRNAKPEIKPERRNGHKKKATKHKDDGEKSEPSRGPHIRSIKVLATGEMISRFELNRRLKEYQVEIGTELHSPKHGKMRVELAQDGGALSLVSESGEQL